MSTLLVYLLHVQTFKNNFCKQQVSFPWKTQSDKIIHWTGNMLFIAFVTYTDYSLVLFVAFLVCFFQREYVVNALFKKRLNKVYFYMCQSNIVERGEQ